MNDQRTFTITREMLDADGWYIGEEDLSNFCGNIHAEKNLGTVKFKGNLRASLHIMSPNIYQQSYEFSRGRAYGRYPNRKNRKSGLKSEEVF